MNPIKFWEYICRVVVPIPGDIELRAGQWHFFHFGISFLITLFIGSVLWLITDSNIYYLIVAVVVFGVFIWYEYSQAGIDKEISNKAYLRFIYDFKATMYVGDDCNTYITIKPGIKRFFIKVNDTDVRRSYLLYDSKWIELRDILTVLNQYASCWLVPLWAYGHYTWAIAVFGVILAIYYLTIKWAKP